MHKIILGTAVFALITLTNFTAQAQEKEKKEAEKLQTTTVDAWRNALPVNEQQQPTRPSPVAEESETVETSAEIETKVLELEKRLLEALKGRDSATLKTLLADDFLFAGINIAGAKSDKIRYINWAIKNLELKSFILDKSSVRTSPTMAIVSYNYKRQANIGGAPSDGDFVVTSVWVKRANQWLAVSHHISPLPKP